PAIATLSLHDALPIFLRQAADLGDITVELCGEGVIQLDRRRAARYAVIQKVLRRLAQFVVDQSQALRDLAVQRAGFHTFLAPDQDRKSTRLNSSHVKI